MCNITLASFTPPTPPSVPLGAGTYSLYLDFTSETPGATLSGVRTPLIGPGVTMVNSPIVDGVGIGGRPAPFFSATALQYMLIDALASIANGADPVFTMGFRAKRDYPLGGRSLFGFGNSGQSTTDYLYAGYAAGAGNSPVAFRRAVSESIVSVANSAPLDYDDHTVFFVVKGTTLDVYVDAIKVVDNVAFDSGDLTCNKLALAARFTTAALEHLGGWVSHACIAPSALNGTQVQTVHTAWTGSDLGTPGKADGTPVQFFGDSITQGDSDTYATTATRGGFRYRLYEWLRTNRYRITMVGHRTQGIFANPEHSSLGGSDTTTINNTVTANIDTYVPECVFVMAGTNNATPIENATQTLAGWRTQYDGLLNNIRTRLNSYSSGADRQIIVANLTPIESGAGGDTVIGAMNTELVSAWDAHDAAYPGSPALIRCDFHTAIGGVWASGNFKDSAHPNAAGYDLLGAELISEAGSYFASIAG